MKFNFSTKILKITIFTIFLFSTCRSDASDLTKRVIANIVKNAPEFQKENDNSPATRTSIVSRIVQNGFTTFRQSADLQLYGGVDGKHLIDFLNYVKNSLEIPQEYSKYFVENLSMIEFADFNELVIYRIFFAKDKGGNCKYVCVMGERNNNGSTNWLVGDLKSTFTLAPDLLVVQKTKSALWGLYKSKETKIYTSPKNLTEEQLNVLFRFFEICVFERFAELLKIDVSRSKFLD
jgi:hypothetical protein